MIYVELQQVEQEEAQEKEEEEEEEEEEKEEKEEKEEMLRRKVFRRWVLLILTLCCSPTFPLPNIVNMILKDVL